MNKVLTRIQQITAHSELNCDRPEILLLFRAYCEEGAEINKPEILDVCNMGNLGNIPLQELDMGLKGVAGVGLRLISEIERIKPAYSL